MLVTISFRGIPLLMYLCVWQIRAPMPTQRLSESIIMIESLFRLSAASLAFWIVVETLDDRPIYMIVLPASTYGLKAL